MLKKAYKIDKDGFYLEDYIYEDNQTLESDVITTEMQQGLYKPKWDDEKWIEGGTINLGGVKQNKINELSQKCNENITNGFYSDADGTSKLYDFNLENQVNLSVYKSNILMSRLSGTPIETISYYAKGEQCHDYTADQFLKLVSDGEIFKATNIVKYKDKLKPMIDACTTVEEVNAITWDTITS